MKKLLLASCLAFCMTGLVSGEYVASNPKSWDKKPLEGNGECVTLVKKAAAITAPTKDWKKGVLVKGANLKEGTIIASFNSDGKYKGHAAIYLGQNKDGIQVIDQWAERKKDGKVIRPAQPPHERTINWNGTGVSNHGLGFYVVN